MRFATRIVMAVFSSCAHDDAEGVEQLRGDLEDLAGMVWLDQSLTGGQVWPVVHAWLETRRTRQAT
jgi:hypothetical protein